MRKLFVTAILFAMVCVLVPRAQSQVTVTGNLKNLGRANVTGSNTFVRFRLNGYGAFLPTVPGTNLVVSDYQDFKPDSSGNIGGTLIPIDVIRPSGTFYQACVYFQGIQFRCGTYLINSFPSTFNINSAPTLATVPTAGPNQLVLQTFPCTQSTPATTWTCAHNFNDSPAIVSVFDTNGHEIFPDTTNVSDPNTTTLTFVTAQSGNALISHAGAITIATNQPNAVPQNPTAGQVIEGPSLIVSSPANFTSSLTCHNFDNVRCVDPANAAGWAGSTVDAWLTAAQTDLGGAGVIQLAAGSYTYGAAFSPNSNITLVGAGKGKTILTAAVGITAAAINLGSVTNVTLRNFTVDGNRALNTNVFDGIDIANSTNVVLDGMQVSNFNNQGVLILGSASYIAIQNSDIQRNGSPVVTVTGTGGVTVAPSGGFTISNIRIGPNNQLHDNNSGVQVFNSSNPANAVSDVSVFENDIYSNVNEGIIPTAFQATGGKIIGFSAKGNRISCNGWPANGTGFSSACTPGFLQTGSVSSSSGCGIDILQNGDQLLVQPIISGNYIHDNVFEAIATTSQIFGTVSTSGTAVTSGTPLFNTKWKAGQVITINQAPFKIASVSSTMSLTLASSAGVQTNVGFAGSSFMYASITGNQSFNNGNSLLGVGPGFFCFMSDGNTYAGNVAKGNNLEGFELDFCSFATLNGDHAYNNGRQGALGRDKGFVSYGGLSNTFWGIAADDLQVSPHTTRWSGHGHKFHE